jgi:hypothetical protein
MQVQGRVWVRPIGVKNPSKTAAQPPPGSRLPSWSPSSHLMTGVHAMSDLVFLILTGAFFALAALIVKGVERL